MISIRVCDSADVPSLQRFNSELFFDNAKYYPDLDQNWPIGEKGKKYFTDAVSKADTLCLIAEDNGKQVGYIVIGPHEVEFSTHSYVEIENMEVTPEYRSQGVGKLLIEEGMRWAKEKGFEKIYVNAFIANNRGISFYEKNGFGEIDIGLERAL